MADGTAQKCGRVGSCHIHLKSLSGNGRAFLCLIRNDDNAQHYLPTVYLKFVASECQTFGRHQDLCLVDNLFHYSLAMTSFFRNAILVLSLTLPTLKVGATIRYVKPIAAGAGNGSSWSDASFDLQGMINASSVGDTLWVATGVYLPTDDPLGNSNPSDARDKTFRLKEGVGVYGGFSGSETTFTARNWVTNPTVLSGTSVRPT